MDENHTDTDTRICPACFAPNSETVDFCCQCGRPIGDFTNYNPVNRIWSQGWMWRRLVSGPIPPFVFYSIWIFFLVNLLCLLPLLLAGAADDLATLLISMSLLLNGILVYRITKNYNEATKVNRGSK